MTDHRRIAQLETDLATTMRLRGDALKEVEALRRIVCELWGPACAEAGPALEDFGKADLPVLLRALASQGIER